MSSFDDDLALAISLSLQEQQPRASSSRVEPIVITDSSEEDKPRPTIPRRPTASKAVKSTTIRPHTTSSKKPTVDPDEVIDLDTTIDLDDDTATEDESDKDPVPKKSNSATRPPHSTKTLLAVDASTAADLKPAPSLTPMSAFGAERAKMEQERLARLQKTRPELVESQKRARSEEDDGESDDERPNKRPSPGLISSSSASASKGKSKAGAGSFNVPDAAGRFWHGAIRQTANKHTITSQDTKPVFRLTEILPPLTASSDPDNTLSFALVSSFALDLPWLYQLFPPEVPVILVAQPGADGKAEVHHALPGWVRTSPALAGGRGCMHVKLMLLFYKSGRLRVVVPTANFVPYDWRDIENSVWLQDVPLRTSSSSSSNTTRKGEGFAERLEYLLRSLNVGPALEAHLVDQKREGEVRLPLRSIDELHSRWDFSLVKVHLVPSIAGKHSGWPEVIRLGHVGLMKAIRDMGAASDKIKIECQGSSIGTYSTAWTNEFMSSARGISPEAWLDIPKTKRSKAGHPSAIRIVFPSLATVDASVMGRPGGGTLFCQKRQWDASTFPKALFVDSNSKRGKILMHSKMILGLREGEKDGPKGWLYVGSHNFTPSAWGNLSGSGFTPIMNITNYELGIVMPLESTAQGNELACWKRPARPYTKGIDVPWMQTEFM